MAFTLKITDIQGQPHTFNYKSMNEKGEEVWDTIRVNSRETVSVEVDEISTDIEASEKLGIILVEKVAQTKAQAASQVSSTGTTTSTTDSATKEVQ